MKGDKVVKLDKIEGNTVKKIEEFEDEDEPYPWRMDGFSRFISSRYPFSEVTDEEISPLVKEQKEMFGMENILRKNTEELEVLCAQTGLELTQENGQRRFGPRATELQSKLLPKGCEVFVGKLPKSLNESQIYHVFRTVGEIYQIRLMMDFSGTNRGFCFIQYYSPVAASRAIKELNHYPISQRRKIGVTLSVDNCRLFIGGIPKHRTEEEIFEELSRVTDRLVRVFARPQQGISENRGFAFAEYETHRDAAMARRKMIPGKIQMWGGAVHVDWAEPERHGVKREPGTQLVKNRGKYFNQFEPPVRRKPQPLLAIEFGDTKNVDNSCSKDHDEFIHVDNTFNSYPYSFDNAYVPFAAISFAPITNDIGHWNDVNLWDYGIQNIFGQPEMPMPPPEFNFQSAYLDFKPVAQPTFGWDMKMMNHWNNEVRKEIYNY